MSRCTPPLTSCIPPPHCDMVCQHDLAAGAPADHYFFPFSWHLSNPVVGWLGHRPFPSHHPPTGAHARHHPPHVLQYNFFAMVPWCLMRPPLHSE